MNSEELGAPAAWQIRDFPERLRAQIIEQARAEELTVADKVLTRCMLALRDAGWPRRVNAGNGGIDRARLAEVIRLCGVYGEAAPNLPRRLRGGASALLHAELGAIREQAGIAPPKRQARLPAPATSEL